MHSSGPDALVESANWRWRAARLLAFGGAALFAFAAWAPWITGILVFSFDQPGSNTIRYPYSYDSSIGIYLLIARIFRNGAAYDPETASRIVSFAWGGVTAIGVLIAPLLWTRLRLRERFTPLYAFAAWLAVATVATVALALVIWGYDPSRDGQFTTVVIAQRHIGWGLWLVLLGLSSAWLGALQLLRERQDSVAEVAVEAAPAALLAPQRRWAAIGLFSVGVGLWLFGFLAIPWVEVNCTTLQLTLNHLAVGACGELDSADALSSQLVQQVSSDTWNLSEGIYPLYGALIGGAALLFVAVWQRPTSRVVALWTTLWLTVASLAAFLAYRGVGIVITQRPALSTDAQGIWHGATGVAVTLFGLVLAWLAILPMEGARWWKIGSNAPPAPPQRPEHDPFAISGDDFQVTRLPH